MSQQDIKEKIEDLENLDEEISSFAYDNKIDIESEGFQSKKRDIQKIIKNLKEK